MTPDALVDLTRTRDLLRTGAARIVRVNAGLSLGEVATSLGVQPSTVMRWENGSRVPRGEAAVTYGRLLEQLMERGGRRP